MYCTALAISAIAGVPDSPIVSNIHPSCLSMLMSVSNKFEDSCAETDYKFETKAKIKTWERNNGMKPRVVNFAK